ncbi:hypothetical protein ACCT20_27030 [Rhizobium ruizarguesonis]|uniref:Uncharacterized protein n=1 Tax=Rhizobium leguminosarum TaxID=384 RepID=A0A6P0DDY5_RHILE|nr:hypothetical protein [Rhizobium leguminosarum]NEK50193.1 hypothetical protein [Rhizobium leguminosarum]TBZ96333.1 hypothetical protein E0H56_04365 [Rhizobium leguminosarum bv. viciae]
MTTPLLPDIDLARIAPLPDDMKRAALRQMKSGFSTFSYKHVRSCFGDLFNIQPAMFGLSEATSYDKIDERLVRVCKAGAELKNNRQIAKALHAFATSGGVTGRHHDFFPLAMGIGRKVSFWLPMVLALEEQPYAVFIDPRRTRGLTQEARHFAFSMMHERIRASDDDFSDINLAIIRFGADDNDGDRAVRLFTDDGVDLYSLDELEGMVSSTYRIWQEVHEERAAEARRKGTGTGGLF